MLSDHIIINETEDVKVYFTSDWHLNHKGPRGCTPLWESRGYKCPEDMTEQILDVTNEIVRPLDILVYGGDFCLDTPESSFESLISKIRCQNVWMLWGNHNSRVSSTYKNQVMLQFGRDDVEVYPLSYRNLKFLGHYIRLIVNGQLICMMHYPIWEWDEKRKGTWMLHGHSHYGFVPGQANSKEYKILDLSWDGHMKPLSFLEVKTIMDTKCITVNDHHVPNK